MRELGNGRMRKFVNEVNTSNANNTRNASNASNQLWQSFKPKL